VDGLTELGRELAIDRVAEVIGAEEEAIATGSAEEVHPLSSPHVSAPTAIAVNAPRATNRSAKARRMRATLAHRVGQP
jgi:hypothetical protein